MRKSSIVKTSVFFVFVFFISQFVFAASDFDAFIDSPLDVFQCEASVHGLEIVNNDVEPLDVYFSASGSASDWVSLPESAVSIAPGSARDVNFDVAVPCDAKLGGYSLKILVFSDSVKKFLELSVDVQKPVNFDVVPNVFLQNVAPCSPVLFNVSVVNKARFADSFSFSIDQFSGAEIVPQNIVLSGGESTDVLVGFTPEDCSLFGEFPVVFTTVAEKTDVRADLDLKLLIMPVDVLTIGEGIDRIVTNHSLSAVKIPVRNNGAESVSYSLSVAGPDWVKLDSDSIDVAAGSDAGFTLLANANDSVVNAPYHVIVSANSSLSGRVYSRDIIIKVVGSGFFERWLQNLGFGWFWFVLSWLFAVKFYLLPVVLVLCVLAGVFVFLRKRKSIVSSGRSLQSSGNVAESVADEKNAVKNAAEDVDSVDVRARRLVEKELRAKFKLVPRSAVVSFGFWSQNFARGLIIALLVLLAGAFYFFRNFFFVYLDFFVLGIIILLALLFFKKFFGKFVVLKRFGFLIAGDDGELFTGWRSGLLRVAFKAADNVDGLRVSVKSGLGRAISPAGEISGAFRVLSNCSDVLLKDVCLTFAVRRSFISGLCASEKDLGVLSFVDGRWQSVDFSVCGSDSRFVFIEILAEHIGVFAVVCSDKRVAVVKNIVQSVSEQSVVSKKSVKSVDEKKKKHQPVALKKESASASNSAKWLAYFVLFVLFALVIGVVVYLVDLKPQELPMPVAGIQPQVWVQDSVHSLDVSRYFSDPDGDVLSYSARPVENIRIDFNGSVAVLAPDAGWSGVRSTVFTATDAGGASAGSNEVSLVVNKLIIPASLEKFLPQIVGGGLFVIVVVILLVFRDKIIKFLDDEDE